MSLVSPKFRISKIVHINGTLIDVKELCKRTLDLLSRLSVRVSSIRAILDTLNFGGTSGALNSVKNVRGIDLSGGAMPK